MAQQQAEEIAIDVTGWLCGQEELLPVFLAASGASTDDLRTALGSSEGPDTVFLVAVLDFILMRDDTVLACAKELGRPPEALLQAHAVLSGAAQTHWT